LATVCFYKETFRHYSKSLAHTIAMNKRKVLLSVGFVALACFLALATTLVLVYSSQSLSHERLQNTNKTYLIYDKHDNLISDELDEATVNINSLPNHVPSAFIAVEDKNFYKHNGLSFGRIGKSALRNIKDGSAKEGASTISQQLIKNTHLSHEKTLKRKIREASLAHKLERSYKKDEILEMYLSVIYFGNGMYGLESASKFYFGKDANALSIKEAAALAATLKSPAGYCPINKSARHEKRTNLVLQLMKEQGHISSEEYEIAKQESLQLVAKRVLPVSKAYLDATLHHAARALNVSQTCFATLGYRVYTYYDSDVQRSVINAATHDNYRIANVSGERSTCVVMASSIDGEISAYYTSNPTMIGSRRNFASALKPITVYTPAIETGVVSPASHINDEPYIAGEFHPKNHDGIHRGAVSVRDSIKHSHNIPAVKVLEYTGIDRASRIANQMGLSLENENLSLALGNTTKGVSFEEMISAYSVLANGGRKTEASFIRRIESRDGRTVWEHPKSKLNVIGHDTAFIMTDMLRGVTVDGTARKLGGLGKEVAAKTGTAERGGSSTNTDVVCIAYTPSCVVMSWQGNTSMQPEHDLPKGTGGGGITSFIIRDVLKASKDLQNDGRSSFVMPSSVEDIEFCLLDSHSGKISRTNEFTPLNQRSTDFFAKRYAPQNASLHFSQSVKPMLDGKISDTGIPLVWFNATAGMTYEIYRIHNHKETLLEVVRNHSGEYHYFDKNAQEGQVNEYIIKAKFATSTDISDSVRLLTPRTNSESLAVSAKKVNSGKLWFF